MGKSIKFSTDENGIYCEIYSDISDYYYSLVFDMKTRSKKVKRILPVQIKKVFNVSITDVTDIDENEQSFKFKIAEKEGRYYRLTKSIFEISNDIFISEAFEISENIFSASYTAGLYRKVENVIQKIDEQIQSPFYIGGENENAIPKDEFQNLLKLFPTTNEKNRYVASRIDSLIKEFVDLKEDNETKYQKIISNKKLPRQFTLPKEIYQYETKKYEFLLKEFEEALSEEDKEIKYLDEKEWQNKVIEIILPLYPKYTHIIPELCIHTDEGKKYIDFVVLDFEGNVDIIEIKKSHNIKVLGAKYRCNYIPSKELKGGTVQAEKYLYHFNRNYKDIQKEIKQRIRNECRCCNKETQDLEKKTDSNCNYCQIEPNIRNPKAILLLGRSKMITKSEKKDFDAEQKRDFEIIKRSYSNIIDIMTFDDLINRMQTLIKHFEHKQNETI